MRKSLWAAMVVGMVGAGPLGAADVARFDGRPAFTEGSDLGYFVWRDGDTWHVRWTTKGAARRFTGSVTADGGDLKSLKRIDVEEERRVLAPGTPAHMWRGPHGRLHMAPGHGPVVAERKQDKIEKDSDRRIFWISRTDADIDGFDFKVDRDVTHLRFALEVDGESRAGQVELGAANASPQQNPFSVDLR
jgi:hypothetical protein